MLNHGSHILRTTVCATFTEELTWTRTKEFDLLYDIV
jgi:hypothetical protein